MPVIKRICIVLLLSSFIIYYFHARPSFSYPEAVSERERDIQAISGLEAEAGLIVQELLTLDMKIDKARQECEAIEKELSRTLTEKNAAAALFEKALEIKKVSLEKTGVWINFQYRYGYRGLVEILFGSKSLADFTGRTAMVSFILMQQAGDYKKAAEACADAREKEESLQSLVDRLNSQNEALAAQISSARALSEQHTAYLAEIKKKSGDLYEKVVALEKQYLASMDLVNYLIGLMGEFSWQDLQPDRISIRSGGILAGISEESLNKSLRQSGIEEFKDISVSLAPGIFSVTGKDKPTGTSFTLSGSLALSGQETIHFKPKSLFINGISVTDQVFSEWGAGSGFTLAVPESMRGQKLSRIEISQGEIDILMSF